MSERTNVKMIETGGGWYIQENGSVTMGPFGRCTAERIFSEITKPAEPAPAAPEAPPALTLKYENPPDRCPECDGTRFMSSGPKHYVCDHCFLVSKLGATEALKLATAGGQP